MTKIEATKFERERLKELIDEIDTARIYAGALGEYYGNKKDDDQLIIFFTARDILRDLEDNLRNLIVSDS